MTKQFRSPDGFKPIVQTEGVELLSGLVVAGEVSVQGTPAFVTLNNIGNGPTNLNLPRAASYAGVTMFIDLQAAAPDGITLVPDGSDTLVNPPGPITAASTGLLLLSNGQAWLVIDITSLI